ncbi:mediator of RNA polymerase II transcription subunit 1-domain-containing protein [Lasiosphaeria hispida]|uniref:Mediator of RNA polymerase II transcription subunit 1 n=1 Tax=Lasiosphaeria hispida TaxID=260671 RepID=A0AAJ0HPX4_9PEZI|nr:mediator of RNA polymerase II transcription subunit 1-domain-containing protein [Lasiosphaeria hispida]
MATPTNIKHALSQQGKTPSQSQHGAAATPPVSTPFSAAHAAFSPHGPRSSPSQVKKSPATATSGTVMGHPGPPSNAAVNFDSPSAAAAFSALQIAGGLDLSLQGLDALGGLGRSTEDERAKRLDDVIAILSQRHGVVSEAGLERLAKRLGLEVLWETAMGVEAKRTLYMGGTALELSIAFSAPNIVQSAMLNFPESADMVQKHAGDASKILSDNLTLEPNQSPLTKEMDGFVANFERMAVLDKLSSPGLNLHEAVAGIYESLNRLHTWELQKAREDPILTGKNDEYLTNLILCTKSGHPAMNARDRVGLSVDYWKEKRLLLSTSPQMAARMAKTEKIWCILIGCAPLRDMGVSPVSPVRVSDKWIGIDIEKIPLPDELYTGTPGPILDWLEPNSNFITPDPSKAGAGVNVLLGPQLPEVAFLATFDPPVHIPIQLWDDIRQLGCGLRNDVQTYKTFDSLVFPIAPGTNYDPSEPRSITCIKKVEFTPRGEVQWSLKTHRSTLYIYKPIYGKTLTEMTFSHPQHIVNMLPYLRQYTFLSTLLENTFKEKPGPSATAGNKPSTSTTATTTRQDDFAVFMEEGAGKEEEEEPLKLDVTLTVHPVPRLQIVFPFRASTANVLLEIRENGRVHVEAQNVLDESNAVAPNGRPRRVEDLGKILETIEDVGKWCEFIRTRWA